MNLIQIRAAEALSSPELARLESCEGVIAKGLETFFEVGTALAEIRDARLYRREFATFDDYCRDRWGIAARTAHQTIKSANAVRLLGDCEVMPQNESVARVLSLLAPDDAKRVWLEAIAGDGRVTAAQLKRLIARAGHQKQNIGSVAHVTCPKCAHVFPSHRPEVASRGSRSPSRGIKWALTLLPGKLKTACDYGCGRFRNAAVLEQRFEKVLFMDTAVQVARIQTLRGARDLRSVDERNARAEVVFVICVLHILPDRAARIAAAGKIGRMGPAWLVIETPARQHYYQAKLDASGHYQGREGTHYWQLDEAQIAALFPRYSLKWKRNIKHNRTLILARN